MQSQYQLGLCFFKGIGMGRSYEEAVLWLQKAAQKDHAGACKLLAECYRKGLGVEQNPDEARNWEQKTYETLL